MNCVKYSIISLLSLFHLYSEQSELTPKSIWRFWERFKDSHIEDDICDENANVRRIKAVDPLLMKVVSITVLNFTNANLPARTKKFNP